MLKKLVYIFSFFIVFSVFAEAKNLLYKLSSYTSTVYILGSIHLAKPELYPLDKDIIKAYNTSDVLVVEVDISSSKAVSQMQKAMRHLGSYPKGKSLKTELSAKTYKALQEYTNKTGISIRLLQKLKPWLVMLQLSTVQMQRLGYSTEIGIDQYFLNRAKKDKKDILSLETIEEQMALLSKDDKDFQDRLLFYALKDMHELEPMLESMYKSWKTGDADSFSKIMSLSIENDPSMREIYNKLITKRNYMMTQKIENLLKTKKDYFVVVGSGHVVGKEGIVDLLKKRGYKVTQH